MTSWLRTSLYSVLGLLFLSGCLWLVLHWFFQVQTEFGSSPHPLQPGILIAHGLLGIVAVFFIGWIFGAHVASSWKRGMNRSSGIILIAMFGVLAATGFGTYYLTSDPILHADALVHEVIGLACVLPVLLHWLPDRNAPKA